MKNPENQTSKPNNTNKNLPVLVINPAAGWQLLFIAKSGLKLKTNYLQSAYWLVAEHAVTWGLDEVDVLIGNVSEDRAAQLACLPAGFDRWSRYAVTQQKVSRAQVLRFIADTAS